MDNRYDSIDRSDVMIKIGNDRKKWNTILNENESLKYENNNLKAKIILLQDDIISLQRINTKQKEELLEYKNKEVKVGKLHYLVYYVLYQQ